MQKKNIMLLYRNFRYFRTIILHIPGLSQNEQANNAVLYYRMLHFHPTL